MSEVSDREHLGHPVSRVACGLPVSLRQGAAQTPCFTAGTIIKTAEGEIAAEAIIAGTRVLTRDNGYQSVIWAGTRDISAEELRAAPHLAPVRIAAGALGNGLPERDLSVSPQHRMLLSNMQIRQWFQSDEVLVAAQHMTCYPGVTPDPAAGVHYVHFMFRQHEIVLANGCWSESFQPRDMSVGALGEAHRREILEIFPELAKDESLYEAARPTLDPTQTPDALKLLLSKAAS